MIQDFSSLFGTVDRIVNFLIGHCCIVTKMYYFHIFLSHSVLVLSFTVRSVTSRVRAASTKSNKQILLRFSSQIQAREHDPTTFYNILRHAGSDVPKTQSATKFGPDLAFIQHWHTACWSNMAWGLRRHTRHGFRHRFRQICEQYLREIGSLCA